MADRESGYERIDGDAYFTPAWPIERVLQAERKRLEGWSLWDPCGGDGILDHVAGKMGYRSLCTDISNGCDMFKILGLPSQTALVSNIPFSIADKVIQRFLLLANRTGAPVIVLLPVDFSSAKSRKWMFRDNAAFQTKHELTDRIRWTNIEQKKDGPKNNHAWYVWDLGRPRNIKKQLPSLNSL